ncbi:hypothetical protein [Planctellipticum variicoloris]|uniref:hypothetical protein n=1 Tax=Planctellipticum variicoloris TaxID=3064265 RepID=UPI003013B1DB|nr:hypothetical protein SH412_001802 [Planctomycetaceae bacterium SH412]
MKASEHFATECELRPEFRKEMRACIQEIDDCRISIESNGREQASLIRVLNIFCPSLDWDHLASNPQLAEEIVSAAEKALN